MKSDLCLSAVAPIQITPEMIEAGVDAYLGQEISHADDPGYTEDIRNGIRAVLIAALEAGKYRLEGISHSFRVG